MAALMPMLAGYALDHVQKKAQADMAFQQVAKMDSYKRVLAAEERAVKAGEGSFIATSAGRLR